MVDWKCVDLSHTYHQVAIHDLKTQNQDLIAGIRNWGTHQKEYLEGCQHENVEPHKRILSSVTNEGEGIKGQRSLEGWTVTKVPPMVKKGFDGAYHRVGGSGNQVRHATFIYVTSPR